MVADSNNRSDLEGRIGRLERQNLALKRGLVALGLVGALALMLAAADRPDDGPDVVSATRIVVGGGPEGGRLVLEAGLRGVPTLSFEHGDRQIRIGMVVAGDGRPVLEFADRDGTLLYQIPR